MSISIVEVLGRVAMDIKKLSKDVSRIADSLERIASFQEAIATDDPLQKLERALSRIDESPDDPLRRSDLSSLEGIERVPDESLDFLWERGFK
jgi:hypothetical protein